MHFPLKMIPNFTKSNFRFLNLLFISMLLCACAKPDYELATGETGSFSTWKGKWVFINYWATWCGPCREEIPELNIFANTRTDIAVFGVNFDHPQGEALKKEITEMGITFPVLTQDPAQALHFEQPSVLPVTVILNPQGKIHTTLLGPQTQKTLAAAIGVVP